MPRSPSSTEDESTSLRREAASSFRRYEEASPAEQRRVDISIISQLGTERSAMWSRWIAEVGSNLGEIEQAKPSVPFGLRPPPEPPSTLVDDIALLRSEIARELLKAWAQLGRWVLQHQGSPN